MLHLILPYPWVCGFVDKSIPMLCNCGLDVSGVEITDGICKSVMERMKTAFGISCDIRQGTNAVIPYEDNSFDYVLACHSIYYVEDNTSFSDNLKELARVMKSEGYVVLSLPDLNGTILDGAISCGDGHYRITFDSLCLRQGSIFKVFLTKDEICQEFSKYFCDFSFGHCVENYYGLVQSMWIVCMRRQ